MAGQAIPLSTLQAILSRGGNTSFAPSSFAPSNIAPSLYGLGARKPGLRQFTSGIGPGSFSQFPYSQSPLNPQRPAYTNSLFPPTPPGASHTANPTNLSSIFGAGYPSNFNAQRSTLPINQVNSQFGNAFTPRPNGLYGNVSGIRNFATQPPSTPVWNNSNTFGSQNQRSSTSMNDQTPLATAFNGVWNQYLPQTLTNGRPFTLKDAFKSYVRRHKVDVDDTLNQYPTETINELGRASQVSMNTTNQLCNQSRECFKSLYDTVRSAYGNNGNLHPEVQRSLVNMENSMISTGNSLREQNRSHIDHVKSLAGRINTLEQSRKLSDLSNDFDQGQISPIEALDITKRLGPKLVDFGNGTTQPTLWNRYVATASASSQPSSIYG
ncbi:uncharacterized protein IL334_002958 [Kwoniella shivajii]|uniref:Nucleoporin Nup54 alpha-helical domain-containing protein n=1 Tax=Kwoniella shivajii TaxID=564305 RepID=A0ABZ1CW71_9TREE|nr:hypothetical protein IL334_002958 [Kwoniella shivajii]